jgi:hypothetical protein
MNKKSLKLSTESIEDDCEILFFTCATGFHEGFVIPYIYFAEKSNPNSKFEFIVGNANRFIEKNRLALEWLENNMGVKPVFRSRDEIAIKPRMENSLRFIMQPKQRAKRVYIGDVDIMILENISDWHKPIFEAGLPYSNAIRANTKTLTGLHFSNYDDYYPLPKIYDLIKLVKSDEALLYKIVNRKGKLYNTSKYNDLVKERPVHGIHMSTNRLPFSAHSERVSWYMSYKNIEDCERILNSDEFKDFFDTLNNDASQILINLIFLTRGIIFYGQEFFNKNVRY